MKGEPSMGNELLNVLTQWYDQTIKRYQLIFSFPAL